MQPETPTAVLSEYVGRSPPAGLSSLSGLEARPPLPQGPSAAGGAEISLSAEPPLVSHHAAGLNSGTEQPGRPCPSADGRSDNRARMV